MSTMDNLKAAFAGESQANRRYLAFAKKADEEGYRQAAKLFRAAAAAETVHAHNHLDVMGGVKGTKENLNAAIIGETFEFTEMYPSYIKEAEGEGKNKAKWSFDVANQVEKIHGELFKEALAKMGMEEGPDYHVCPVCGNTVAGPAPDKCPICDTAKDRFILVA